MMTLEERKKKADEIHRSGANCAQSVVYAFEDMFDADHGTLMQMSEGFGYGMGDRNGTCGAVTGAVMVAGLKLSGGLRGGAVTKKATHAAAAGIRASFLEKNGTLICRELKGMDTGKPVRSCADCISDAVEICWQELFSDGAD